MTTASAGAWAALSTSMLLSLAGPGAWASDRVETVASVTIVRPATVTVVNNTPLQMLLLTTAVSPALVFTSSGGGPIAVGATGSGAANGGRIGSDSSIAGATDALGPGLSAVNSGATDGQIALSGSLTGTTINGDAVSVSVGNVSGGSAPGSGRVSAIIAQYN